MLINFLAAIICNEHFIDYLTIDAALVGLIRTTTAYTHTLTHTHAHTHKTATKIYI